MLAIDLSGKIALITGASGELGRVMARTLAQAGADIVVHYNSNADTANTLVDELQALGRQAVAVQADITDAASIDALKEQVINRLGAPDIVITNAVIQYQWTTVLQQDIADYESQFRSCVVQNVLMAKAFIPGMIEKGGGRFIGINTECVMQCWPSQSAYVSGKRGMDGALRVLADEVGKHGITVNQVAPGWTVSETRPENDNTQWYRDKVPLRRRGTDQEIANAVAFIASDLASFITRAYLPVCGGNVMPGI